MSQRVLAVRSLPPLSTHTVAMEETLQHRIRIAGIPQVPEAREGVARRNTVQHGLGEEHLAGDSHASESRSLERKAFGALCPQSLFQGHEVGVPGSHLAPGG